MTIDANLTTDEVVLVGEHRVIMLSHADILVHVKWRAFKPQI